ncbi:esterase/lipase family protein [Spirillospora sp. CA-294931]|uniref:esterase/lipase family protein n=1 Tax=Spirillospora sp. CA-294931 TaxID=3240042 RepID=UPI003D8F07AD
MNGKSRAGLLALAATLPLSAVSIPAEAAPVSPRPATSAAAPRTGLEALAAKGADSKNRTVIFIHGFQIGQKADCYGMWKKSIDFFRSQGWAKKNLITWGYYKNNTHCTSKYKGSTMSDLGNVGAALNKYIRTNFTDKGKKVDVVAHSTGSLIIRNAIIQSHLRPGKLYVEDVVTLGTPHDGSKWGHACNATQCKQLRPGSDFIKGLNHFSTKAKRYHEGDGGTNWTLVGSYLDGVTSAESGTSKNVYAKHRILYPKSERVGHPDYYQTGTGEGWTYYRSNNYSQNYHKVTTSAGPIRMAYRGAYYHSKW